MDPLTGATTFATVVSLLAEFSNQRQDRAARSFDEFMAWLQEERHSEIKDLLQRNTGTVIGIKALLNEDHAVLAQRLDQMDRSLAAIASAVDGFSAIAEVIHPGARISQQALRVLEQFEASKASQVLFQPLLMGAPILQPIDGKQEPLEYEDPRFIEDDLATLVELRLLRRTSNSSGSATYLWTRAASDFINSVARRA